MLKEQKVSTCRDTAQGPEYLHHLPSPGADGLLLLANRHSLTGTPLSPIPSEVSARAHEAMGHVMSRGMTCTTGLWLEANWLRFSGSLGTLFRDSSRTELCGCPALCAAAFLGLWLILWVPAAHVKRAQQVNI